MTTLDAIQEIKSRYPEYLTEARTNANGKPTYICTLCRNGEGSSGDGLAIDPHGDGTQLKCFKCGFYGDIIDLHQKKTGCDFKTAVTALSRQFNITVDDSPINKPVERRNAPERANIPPATQNATEDSTAPTESKPDFTAYYKQCREQITAPAAQAYLSFRGISEATATRFFLGYDPEKRFIIIPAARSFYIARNTDRAAAMRYQNPKGASIELFNLQAVYNDEGKPVFITEGAFDALSIIEAGGEAIALNSTSNTGKLLKELENKHTANTLILSLDNDDAGKKASSELADGLKRLNIHFTGADICGQHKDANEALTADRAAFIKTVNDTEKTIRYPGLLTPERAARILAGVDDHYINMPSFPVLSACLKLRTHDTVIIAGDTGSGKSSVSLNILHDIQDRYPALYINLEMDEATVIQRLVAIHTGIILDDIERYKSDPQTRADVDRAILEITQRQPLQLLAECRSLPDIEKQIKATTQGRDTPTIVFVDTGLLVTTEKTAGRYERFTQISEELRRIALKYNVVLFIILQQSRSGKDEGKKPANGSLKESGSWENDATKIFFVYEEPYTQQKQLIITKNRNGRIGDINLNYDAQTQTYTEGEACFIDKPAQARKAKPGHRL